MMRLLRILSRGLSARIVHANMANQALGWAVEWRRRGVRSAMRDCALEFRRELAEVHLILELEAERPAVGALNMTHLCKKCSHPMTHNGTLGGNGPLAGCSFTLTGFLCREMRPLEQPETSEAPRPEGEVT